jgi:LysM repeat protein
MKKYIIIIQILLSVIIVNALDSYVPAQEMSGNYLRFKTCYQKLFGDFDGGFDNFGFSVAKPGLFKNYALALDLQSHGDGVLRDLTFNISPGVTFNKRFTFAISGGFLQRSLETEELIFGEAETISETSAKAATIGASFYGKMLREKLHMSLGLYHLNQPEISFINSDDFVPIKATADVKWHFNQLYNVGAFFLREDEQNYVGINFGIKFPAPFIAHDFAISKEKVTYRPSIQTFNYWNVQFGYNLYRENKDLGYENYGICVSYDYIGGEKPLVSFPELPEVTEDEEMMLNFKVLSPERLNHVTVYQNEEPIFHQKQIWEHESKQFSVPIQLQGEENRIVITVEGVNKKVFEKEYSLYRYVESTIPEEEIPVEEVEEPEVEEPEEEIEEEVDAVILMVEDDGAETDTREMLENFYYEVRKGDNLWNIAKKPDVYNDAWKWKLIYENNSDSIDNPDLIFPGQQFLIVREMKNDDVRYYKVEKGDNLWNIAKKKEFFGDGTKWKIIYLVNKEKIKDPDLIYPGQNLKIIIRETE